MLPQPIQSPISFLSLPSELYLVIFALVGGENNHYTARERANDLFNFALVHSRFLYPSQSLLYRSLSIRNSGRANLLLHTFVTRPELIQYCQFLSYIRSDSDKSISPDLIEILSITRPTTIELGARLFGFGKPSIRLRDTLRLNTTLTSFAYGLSQWSISKSIDSSSSELGALSLLEDLLPSFLHLQQLTIRNCATKKQNLPQQAPPPPSYQLTSLILVNVDFWPSELSFLLGSTSTSLRHLTLNKISILTSSNLLVSDAEALRLQEEEMIELLSSRLDSLNSLHLFDTTSPFNVNTLLTLAPNLNSFHLGATSNLPSQSINPLHLPSSLAYLTIQGLEVFKRLELFALLLQPPLFLKKVTLVGVVRSSLAAVHFENRKFNGIRNNGWNDFEIVYQSMYS